MVLKNNYLRITNPNFFTAHATDLARKLLGKILVRNINGQLTKVKIVETEAYDGNIDRACHAHLENKSRWKASALSNRGGCAYVYLIYGMYYCFNIASSVKGDPQGVLIRAAEPLNHHTIPILSQHDPQKKYQYYTNGPGKLCRALNIDVSLNNADLTTSDLIYLENGSEISQEEIVITKRVNVDYAGEDKDLLWRFYIKNNPFVSRK
ncbi:MAG: DNA-3-methyladenine glycosylase [Candidatus Moeniiplasma glomeromycotorum]|nr:DNA-3-methyladenine glycosylase [Candidatus Moeniiplasma glomeromycotorum]MCE8168068.1 DNA-3-methyladenine glycosylase [Candidatus Moeniiplasma glomeromycotorum]MCE8169623.1 DNA-3-methyladenine glycosylase [Candidatus Moeniiplasma glomeromycotorum]